jgi:hypothetical protein
MVLNWYLIKTEKELTQKDWNKIWVLLKNKKICYMHLIEKNKKRIKEEIQKSDKLRAKHDNIKK